MGSYNREFAECKDDNSSLMSIRVYDTFAPKVSSSEVVLRNDLAMQQKNTDGVSAVAGGVVKVGCLWSFRWPSALLKLFGRLCGCTRLHS